MPTTSYDPRSLLKPLLVRLRLPAERRQLANALRSLAEVQDRIADADERSGHIVRQERIKAQAERQKTGRPKGSGARFLRYALGEPGSSAGCLFIGRALWQELGEPRRVDVQRIGGQLFIRPCEDSIGWRVSQPANGMPMLGIGLGVAATLQLEVGHHPASIKDGAIVCDC